MHFAKLFTYDTGQLLVTRSHSDQPQDAEEPYKIALETRAGAVRMEATHSYAEQAQCDEDFDGFGDDQAQHYFTKYQAGLARP